MDGDSCKLRNDKLRRQRKGAEETYLGRHHREKKGGGKIQLPTSKGRSGFGGGLGNRSHNRMLRERERGKATLGGNEIAWEESTGTG